MLWRKASASREGACVEVAILRKGTNLPVFVRDSKDPGPILRFSPKEWAAFLDGVKAGEFDL